MWKSAAIEGRLREHFAPQLEKAAAKKARLEELRKKRLEKQTADDR